MAVLNTGLAKVSGEAFTLDQSLRFEDGSSAYLSKTPAGAGNLRTWTWSGWVKRGNIPSARVALFEAYSSGSLFSQFVFDSTHELYFYTTRDGVDYSYETEAVLRDPNAWYHILVKCDTTDSTEADRFIVYINGERQSNNNQYGAFALNVDTAINATLSHKIGYATDSTVYLDGYLAEVHFIDGTALTPTSFGETGDYGEWKPIEVSGLTYGTNGFYLSFAGGGVMSATGGDSIGTDGDYKYNTFLSDGTFTPTITGVNQSDVEYLVIAGGGGGGGGHGGGGGAGGYKTGTLAVTSGTGYAITVGTGGAVGTLYSTDSDGDNGTNSVFSTITSTGGGGGGGYNDGSGSARNGKDGGSGGSGVGEDGSDAGSASPAGQGNDGGEDAGAAAGGGGGAGAVGADATATGSNTTSISGAGGNGLSSSITGSAVTRAGGGAGGCPSGGTGASGGSGGGGAATNGSNTVGGAGTPNTGSGGGGGSGGNPGGTGGLGGSGIVIIRYKWR